MTNSNSGSFKITCRMFPIFETNKQTNKETKKQTFFHFSISVARKGLCLCCQCKSLELQYQLGKKCLGQSLKIRQPGILVKGRAGLCSSLEPLLQICLQRLGGSHLTPALRPGQKLYNGVHKPFTKLRWVFFVFGGLEAATRISTSSHISMHIEISAEIRHRKAQQLSGFNNRSPPEVLADVRTSGCCLKTSMRALVHTLGLLGSRG